jgi:ubiquitin-protein ligase
MTGNRHRRLFADIEKLRTEFPHIRFMMDEHSTRLTFRSPHDRHFSLTIPEDYPFKPPVVSLNGKLFRHLSLDISIERLFQTLYDVCPCPCCVTILGSHWSPCLSFVTVCTRLFDHEKKWIRAAQHYLHALHIFPDDIEYRIAEYM